MKNYSLSCTILFLLTFLINPKLQAQEGILEKLNEIAIIDQKVMVPMRDGIRLATDIYRPKNVDKAPIIFSRTPHTQDTHEASHTYIHVCICEKGRMKPWQEGLF